MEPLKRSEKMARNHLDIYFSASTLTKVDSGPHYEIENSPLRHDKHIHFAKFRRKKTQQTMRVLQDPQDYNG